MKRTPVLAPLSREHHHALVLAKALVNATAADAGPIAARFVSFLGEHERSHFALEESVLLPAVPTEETGARLVEQVLEDHAFLRYACEQLQASLATPSVALLHSAGSRLRAHVRLEERELFPLIERTIPEPELVALAERLAPGSNAGQKTAT
jgi:hemerythrin-like domain-containing protein